MSRRARLRDPEGWYQAPGASYLSDDGTAQALAAWQRAKAASGA